MKFSRSSLLRPLTLPRISTISENTPVAKSLRVQVGRGRSGSQRVTNNRILRCEGCLDCSSFFNLSLKFMSHATPRAPFWIFLFVAFQVTQNGLRNSGGTKAAKNKRRAAASLK